LLSLFRRGGSDDDDNEADGSAAEPQIKPQDDVFANPADLNRITGKKWSRSFKPSPGDFESALFDEVPNDVPLLVSELELKREDDEARQEMLDEHMAIVAYKRKLEGEHWW